MSFALKKGLVTTAQPGKSLGKDILSKNIKHETTARAWCTGKTQRDRVEREVGGGNGMGNTCKYMANSCQCMTKTTTML